VPGCCRWLGVSRSGPCARLAATELIGGAVGGAAACARSYEKLFNQNDQAATSGGGGNEAGQAASGGGVAGDPQRALGQEEPHEVQQFVLRVNSGQSASTAIRQDTESQPPLWISSVGQVVIDHVVFHDKNRGSD
jgi:hypothetical protein